MAAPRTIPQLSNVICRGWDCLFELLMGYRCIFVNLASGCASSANEALCDTRPVLEEEHLETDPTAIEYGAPVTLNQRRLRSKQRLTQEHGHIESSTIVCIPCGVSRDRRRVIKETSCKRRPTPAS